MYYLRMNYADYYQILEYFNLMSRNIQSLFSRHISNTFRNCTGLLLSNKHAVHYLRINYADFLKFRSLVP